ncbi:MAG TPA: prolyl oligopeptidase family serine peptidase [Acidimicrobiales bacterium]|nr:prolyl oligopeptidase family serine peptidase [Acidimicrobiales bacterium]
MYPQVRKGDVVDDLHGEKVADPYRWLEDADSQETADFVRAENALSESFLAGVPSRPAIRARLQDLWDYARFSVPFEVGGLWFQYRNPGLANQNLLYVMTTPEDEGRVLLDPNGLAEDGTVAVTTAEVSPDGRFLAYSLSGGGSDWLTWHVREVATGEDLADVVKWSKFSGAAWLKDGSGFYYGAPETPREGTELVAESRHQRILLHKLGTSQGADELVFEAPDEPDWLPRAHVTDDGRYLIVSISRGTRPQERLLVLDLEQPDAGLQTLIGDFASYAEVITTIGSAFYVLTDAQAERRRLVEISLAQPEAAAWREVIPEADDTLVAVTRCGAAFVCHYLHDAHSILRVHGLSGAFRHEVAPWSFASVEDPDGHYVGVRASERSNVLYCKAISCLESGSIWSHDVESGTTKLERPSASRFAADTCVTEQVFVTSGDGTSLPVFVSRRRDLAPSGDVPVLIHGYGGFNVPNTPVFRTFVAVWLERGGIYAEAVLRGGGEYGSAWNEAGKLANKQNVFDDFAACARWFSSSGWSSPERTAICGGSNGGLLVGATITQHPELVGAAVAEVGVLDMLRFHLFTIGWAWTSDFGNPDDASEYKWSRAYSPLHNIVEGRHYPATLIMTGDHDDRVVPAHSFKFAAALQAAQGGPAPVLLRVAVDTGHGLGKPTAMQIEERTDFLCFLEMALGLAGANR